MQGSVRDNNVDQALARPEKNLQREGGVFREMKLKQHFLRSLPRKSAREK